MWLRAQCQPNCQLPPTCAGEGAGQRRRDLLLSMSALRAAGSPCARNAQLDAKALHVLLNEFSLLPVKLCPGLEVAGLTEQTVLRGH